MIIGDNCENNIKSSNRQLFEWKLMVLVGYLDKISVNSILNSSSSYADLFS